MQGSQQHDASLINADAKKLQGGADAGQAPVTAAF
jgi:hypothetical protein